MAGEELSAQRICTSGKVGRLEGGAGSIGVFSSDGFSGATLESRGGRTLQADFVLEDAPKGIFAIADATGQTEESRDVSFVACEAFHSLVSEGLPNNLVTKGIERADNAVRTINGKGLGEQATFIGTRIQDGQIEYCSVGDSKFYEIDLDAGKIIQINESDGMIDQLVEFLVSNGGTDNPDFEEFEGKDFLPHLEKLLQQRASSGSVNFAHLFVKVFGDYHETYGEYISKRFGNKRRSEIYSDPDLVRAFVSVAVASNPDYKDWFNNPGNLIGGLEKSIARTHTRRVSGNSAYLLASDGISQVFVDEIGQIIKKNIDHPAEALSKIRERQLSFRFGQTQDNISMMLVRPKEPLEKAT